MFCRSPYLAWGLAKTAGVAGIMSFTFVAISPKGPAAQEPRWAAIMEMAAWTGLATLAGLVCASVTFAYASVLARWGRFRLWLSSDIHRVRRRNEWPPSGTVFVQNNRVAFLLLGAILFSVLPPLLFVTIFLAIFAQLGGLLMGLCCITASMFLMFCFPVLALVGKDRVSRWLIATDPSECWEIEAAPWSEQEIVAEMSGNPVK